MSAQTVFSVDLDEACLEFDPIDNDPADGIPDDVIFAIPTQFSGTVNYSAEDTDGELDFVIFDFGPPPLAALPDGPVAHIIVTPSCQPEGADILARVGFSGNPAPSFGGTNGQGISGTSSDGSMQIGDPIFADGFESGDTSAWSVTEASNRRRSTHDYNAEPLRHPLTDPLVLPRGIRQPCRYVAPNIGLDVSYCA